MRFDTCLVTAGDAQCSFPRTFDAHQLQHASQGVYSRDSGVEIQPGDFGGSEVLCKTATRLAKQTRPIKRRGEGF